MTELHNTLSKHRFNQALTALQSAEYLIERKDYNGAANRIYYAVFHALRSVLAIDQVDFKKHSAVIAYFRKTYIKTNIFPIQLSKTIGTAFDLRAEGDYDDYYDVSEEEAVNLAKETSFLLNQIQQHLQNRIAGKE